jgi:NTP pyrophosphatase (non-canonical NTP hydrolase)
MNKLSFVPVLEDGKWTVQYGTDPGTFKVVANCDDESHANHLSVMARLAVVAHEEHNETINSIDDYVTKTIKTETIDYTLVLQRISSITNLRLLHGIIGKVTEIGELADNFKRHIFYGTPLLVTEKGGLVEELGDDSWYSALIASVTESLNGDTFSKILEKNIAKLAKRYKKGFSEEEAVNRNLNAEGETLKSSEKC